MKRQGHVGLILQAAVFALLALTFCTNATASSLTLVRTDGTDPVAVGDLVSLDVVVDFTGEPTLGAGFDIDWDPTAFSFESLAFTVVGDPSFNREPDILDGTLQGWAFGDFAGISDVQVLGTLQLSVLPTMGASSSVEFGCSGLHSCLFLSSDDLLTPLDVDFFGVEITRVPLPPAGLLFVCALALLRPMRGRSTR